MMLTSIKEREREIQLLRVIGAPAFFLFLLIELEALLISFMSMLLGTAGLYLSLIITRDLLSSNFGLHIGLNILSLNNSFLLLLIAGSTMIAAAIPALTVYKSAHRGG